MDGARFDTMIRKLAPRTSARRTILRLAAGGLLGGLLGWPAVEEAAACRKDERPCKRSRQCCSGKCRRGNCFCPRKRRCGGACCPNGEICVDKATKTCATGRGTCKKLVTESCPVLTALIPCNAPAFCSCMRTTEGTVRCGFLLGGNDLTCCNSSADCEGAPPNVPGMYCSESARDCEECDPALGFRGQCGIPCSIIED